MTLLDVFEPVEAGKLIRERGIHHVNGPDDLLKRLLDVYPDEERPYPSLRSCVYAAFNPTLAAFPQEAERRGLHLLGAFGMTEIYSFFSVQPHDAPLDVRASSGGMPVNPNTRLRARSRETGEVLPHGEVGELEIWSDTLFDRYFQNSEATGDAFALDRFFRTGDLGFTRDDGTFGFLGRAGTSFASAAFSSTHWRSSRSCSRSRRLRRLLSSRSPLSEATNRWHSSSCVMVMPSIRMICVSD